MAVSTFAFEKSQIIFHTKIQVLLFVWSNLPSYGGVKYEREIRNSYYLVEVKGYSLICITLLFNANRVNFVVNFASFSERILS